jgi:hypothetical protein
VYVYLRVHSLFPLLPHEREEVAFVTVAATRVAMPNGGRRLSTLATTDRPIEQADGGGGDVMLAFLSSVGTWLAAR